MNYILTQIKQMACRTLSTLALLLVGSSNSLAAEFIPLGYEFGTFGLSQRISVSEDGGVVALWTADDELMRWTRATGAEVVLEEVRGASLSGDGSIIVTSRILAREPNRLSRGVKIIGDTIEDLPLPIGENYSEATVISQDGNTIVGSVFKPNFFGTVTRWTDGAPEYLPMRWIAQGVSRDGTVVVDSFNRWTAETGAVEFQDLQGTGVRAIGMSSDGRWTVGQAETPSAVDRRAVLIDGTSPPQALNPADTNWGSSGYDVTEDGSLVVGYLWVPDQTELRTLVAGIWTEQLDEMVPLQGLLEEDPDLQESLEDWHLSIATDVSDDGRYMVGAAINPDGILEAFWLDAGSTIIPEPASLVTAAIGGLSLVLIGRRRLRRSSS